MLILYETPAGYALFKCMKEGKTEKVEDVMKYFANSKEAKKLYYYYNYFFNSVSL
jgi:nucleolar protein 58